MVTIRTIPGNPQIQRIRTLMAVVQLSQSSSISPRAAEHICCMINKVGLSLIWESAWLADRSDAKPQPIHLSQSRINIGFWHLPVPPE